MIKRNQMCPCGSGLRYKACCGKGGDIPSEQTVPPENRTVEPLRASAESGESPSRVIKRNQLCPCGSGLRYKACCGKGENITHGQAMPPEKRSGEPTRVSADKNEGSSRVNGAGVSVHQIMQMALDEQRKGDLDEAEKLYRMALKLSPNQPDCLNMLGVICMDTGRYDEAHDHIKTALDLTAWNISSYRHNFGLAIAKKISAVPGFSVPLASSYQKFQEEREERAARALMAGPKVSVVIPSYNHARWVCLAIRSVFDQTYGNVELIIIDDGSTDGSGELIEHYIADAPIDVKFISRENRGAHATINQGVELARGEFVNILNSDDFFSPRHIALMVAHVAATGALWGFGTTRHIDELGRSLTGEIDPRVGIYEKNLRDLAQMPSIGMAFLRYNLSVSTGNIFFSKRLFSALRGFGDYRYNHDWDFCLRATLYSEPGFCHEPSYNYRLHGSNTISESSERARAEMMEIFRRHFKVLTAVGDTPNPFAPTLAHWGNVFYKILFGEGLASLLSLDEFRMAYDRMIQLIREVDAGEAAAS